MRRIALLVALAALLASAAPAAAAKSVTYKGRTSGGQPITFKVRGGKIYNPEAGVPVSCLPIQGPGAPQTGVDLMHPEGWVKIGDAVDFSYLQKPYAHYNDVTMNQRFSSRRGKGGVISGALRMQYSFLVPKYPIGTFSTYSCLGNATYTAKPRR